MGTETAADLRAYLADRWRPMLRTAYLVCGDAAVAHDAVRSVFITLRTRFRTMPTDELDTWVSCQVIGRIIGDDKESGTIGLADMDDDELWEGHLRLPSRIRAVLVMRLLDALPDDKIAIVLGLPGDEVAELTRAGLGPDESGETAAALGAELARRGQDVADDRPPIVAIERAMNRPRRLRAVSAIAMVVAVASVGIAITRSADERTPAPDGGPMIETTRSMLDWAPRGSLGQDRSAVEKARALVRSATGPASRTAVIYVGDTPAGPLVIGVNGNEIVARTGPPGTGIDVLEQIGFSGELPDDGVVSRVLTDPMGQSWLFVLADRKTDTMEISWAPAYRGDGTPARDWTAVPHDAGVILTPTPGPVLAARVRTIDDGVTTGDRPVFEDSKTLNQPGFLPLARLSEPPLPPGVDLAGADERTVRWALGQVEVAVPGAGSQVRVRWALENRALLSLETRGGGVLSVYADLGMEYPYLDVVPVARVDADRAIAVVPVGEGVWVIAPHARGSGVRIGPAASAVTDQGYAVVPGDSYELMQGAVEIDGAVTDLTSEARTDPFDLR
ncbi:hypothetical protein [Actinokineospora sp.]|uniref:hypothetical protein n=1 Tax=Actinokineospora sp. TaxID=1872133 RepID=UPI003D6A70E7